ncbi:MAG: ABC transporter permease subunit [Cyanobacteria bacterium RI_101]|nr:ABC transporter permease subunit [Cyanobacteria bacterium RI_101]
MALPGLSALRRRLFPGWFSGGLSLVLLAALVWSAGKFFAWSFGEAHWSALSANYRLFFAGRYPVESLWRLGVCLALLAGGAGLTWGWLAPVEPEGKSSRGTGLIAVGALLLLAAPGGGTALAGVLALALGTRFSYGLGRRLQASEKPRRRLLAPFWLANLTLMFWLLLGGGGLRPAPADDLSGLVLTLLAAILSIVLSFPLGLLLALGRRSSLPAIRWLATLYIELVRALPLIGILFIAQVMLPLVLPPGWRPDRVVRAIAGFTLFSAAYLAENVRGGLQSIPQGQGEAARALGLNPVLTLGLIILPQALRAAIPALVGQFLSLFKDTSLLAIVGLVDLLGMGQSILANPKFVGDYAEVYLFIALIYLVCCGALSWAGRAWEKPQG